MKHETDLSRSYFRYMDTVKGVLKNENKDISNFEKMLNASKF